MDRAEFMRRLSDLLQDVPPAEREEALQYYNDYLDDAGVGNEAGVIASLGTPEELARTIKAGLTDGGNGGEFTEAGFQGYERRDKNQIMSTDWKQDERQGGTQDGAKEGTFGGNPGGQPGKSMSGGQIALMAILLVLTSPVWIGILGGLLGCVIGLFGGMLGLFFAFLAVGVVFSVVGVCLVIGGIAAIFGAPLAGLSLVGVGLILTSLGLLFTCLMVWMVGSVIPALFRGCVNLCSRLFHRGGAKA
ncbi:MAG: hypothetical protein K2M22_00285 [Lachnospiraceae bacterium]|nr:hypothetical protein [Lachnospiraceae bacterium]MDE7178065.1 hypothetical protein [Lachnospiraceae bacterium]